MCSFVLDLGTGLKLKCVLSLTSDMQGGEKNKRIVFVSVSCRICIGCILKLEY